MKIINLSETDSILNQYVSEIRNVEVQNDRLRFRRNIERIGEVMAYEMSKTFAYSVKEIQTPEHRTIHWLLVRFFVPGCLSTKDS